MFQTMEMTLSLCKKIILTLHIKDFDQTVNVTFGGRIDEKLQQSCDRALVQVLNLAVQDRNSQNQIF
jgi:hypothetical protein